MLISRTMSKYIGKAAKGFPVITISGPRQSGKTTFARVNYPDYEFVSLEDTHMREYAKSDPQDFIQRYSEKVIIDEFQRVPELTSNLQSHIDKVNRPGMYVLTGSNQFEYLRNVSQTLAGRTIILKLLPFSYQELYTNKPTISDIYDVMVKGWYPRIFDKDLDFKEFYLSYFDTYIQRDVRSIMNVKDLNDFQNFVRLCAGRTGQLINFSKLANEIGVSYHTIKGWLSILQASFIVEILQPYHRNFNKRIVKSAKMYFLDTGLACSLMGIHNADQLRVHPLRGELFETFAFAELMKLKYNTRKISNLYFFRDNHQNEIDFLVESGYGLIPIEVKLNSTPRKIHFKHLEYFDDLSDNVYKKYLIYSGIESFQRYNTNITAYSDIGRIEF